MKYLRFILFLGLFSLLPHFAFSSSSPTIAVLPFDNVLKSEKWEGLGSGISETIATKLSQANLNLIERGQLTKIIQEIKLSKTGFVGEEEAIKAGKAYGASILILGGYQIIGNYCRITARFIDTETGKIIKAVEETGSIEGKGIFQLQDKIVFALLKTQNIEKTPTIEAKIKKNPTENLTVLQWFGKGYDAQMGIGGPVDLDAAIRFYTNAISIDSAYATPYNTRGLAYDDKGEYDKAISDYNQALRINPNDADAYNNRGNAYYREGEYDKAISDYNQALRINPNYAIAYYNRGFAYCLKGEYDKAISDYNQALRINPNDAIAYYNRAIAYYCKGNYNKAWEDVRKAQNLGYQVNPEFLKLLRKASGREK
jgi:tetratricopeptide (TPR) repeat protein